MRHYSTSLLSYRSMMINHVCVCCRILTWLLESQILVLEPYFSHNDKDGHQWINVFFLLLKREQKKNIFISNLGEKISWTNLDMNTMCIELNPMFDNSWFFNSIVSLSFEIKIITHTHTQWIEIETNGKKIDLIYRKYISTLQQWRRKKNFFSFCYTTTKKKSQ